MTDQPEALILAEKLEEAAGDYSQFDRYLGHESAAMLREQHAEIERLRAENLRAFDSGYDKGVQDTLLDYGVEL